MRKFFIGVVLVVAIGMIWLNQRIEIKRFQDPSGKYECVVSVKQYQRYVPRFPGQGSDAPGYIQIFHEGNSMGTLYLPMLQMLEMEWYAGGARIHGIGEWDFNNGTCRDYGLGR